MQLLPDTAKGIAMQTGASKFVVCDLYDPEINVRYGAWYLRHLLDKYDDERTALAAYNAGQGNVDEWRAEGVGIRFAETRTTSRRSSTPSGSTRTSTPTSSAAEPDGAPRPGKPHCRQRFSTSFQRPGP